MLLAPVVLGACGARSALSVPHHSARYCQGAKATSVYVITGGATLYSFDPPSKTFTPIGILSCPDPGHLPLSMAVDYKGIAYVVYDDGALFEVSLTDATCTATTYVASPSFGTRFGMGFSTDPDGLTETLFLAGQRSPQALGSLDTTTFALQEIGTFSPDIGDAELTGTGDGDLFGFSPISDADSAHFAQIDKTDAAILTDTMVPISFPFSFAFASWGGDFYFFTGTSLFMSTKGPFSTVARLRPSDGAFDASYATLPGEEITGAGVSTCAPR